MQLTLSKKSIGILKRLRQNMRSGYADDAIAYYSESPEGREKLERGEGQGIRVKLKVNNEDSEKKEQREKTENEEVSSEKLLEDLDDD